MRLEIKDLKVNVEANVKSTMVSGYYLDSIRAVVYVIVDNEVDRAKALRCGEFVKSYSFALRALQAGTKIDLITQATVEPS
jgi:hypothetical protein